MGLLEFISYPAGHVFIHDFLSKLTNKGLDLRLAQHIYFLLYLISLTTTCLLYQRAGGIPNYVLLLLPLSKRLHSIFMLRLFNDCWALIFLQNAALAFIYDFNSLGAVFFRCAQIKLNESMSVYIMMTISSVALSIKMSVLLYVPGLMILCFKKMGLMRTLLILATILNIQFIIGYPFLTTYPSSYIASAFEISRVFLYKWTVNWRFVPEDIFLSKSFAIALLFLHLSTLISFAAFKWCSKEGGVIKVLLTGLKRPFSPSNPFVTSDGKVIYSEVILRFVLLIIFRILDRIIYIQFAGNLVCAISALSILQLVRPTSSFSTLANDVPVPNQVGGLFTGLIAFDFFFQSAFIYMY